MDQAPKILNWVQHLMQTCLPALHEPRCRKTFSVLNSHVHELTEPMLLVHARSNNFALWILHFWLYESSQGTCTVLLHLHYSLQISEVGAEHSWHNWMQVNMLGVCIRNALLCRQGIGALDFGIHWFHTQMNLPFLHCGPVISILSCWRCQVRCGYCTVYLTWNFFYLRVKFKYLSSLHCSCRRACNIVRSKTVQLGVLPFQSWPHGPASG